MSAQNAHPPNRIPTADLLESLEELAEDLGRTPTVSDYRERGRYSYHPIRKRLGWNEALRAAGLEINQEYGIPAEKLEADLRRVAEELGEPPKKREYRDLGEYAPSTQMDRFGGWAAALEAAGLGHSNTRAQPNAEDLERLREAWASRHGEA